MVALSAAAASGCASGSVAGAAVAEDRENFVHIRGPGPFDCNERRENARTSGHRFVPFFIELRCRLHPIWTCASTCQTADKLLESRFAVRVDRAGQLISSAPTAGSGLPSYDDMSLAALRGAAPYSAPPPPMLDPAGVLALEVQMSCDCRR